MQVEFRVEMGHATNNEMCIVCCRSVKRIHFHGSWPEIYLGQSWKHLLGRRQRHSITSW